MDKKEQLIKKMAENYLNKFLVNAYHTFGIESGDISLEQLRKYDKIKQELSELTIELIKQNTNELN